MSEPVRFDWARQARTGLPEVVFAQGKQAGHIVPLLDQASQRQTPLLLTRLSPVLYRQIQRLLEARNAPAPLAYHEASRTAVWGTAPVVGEGPGVGIVCAGTSDLPVALEARQTLGFFGCPSRLYADVGVAGLWRLMQITDDLARHPVIIAVAGMEGALFSVLGGLVPGMIIAVPSSVGYGVAQGGQAALSSALASCAPGLVCVNIDNGFGAAAAAFKIYKPVTAGSGAA